MVDEVLADVLGRALVPARTEEALDASLAELADAAGTLDGVDAAGIVLATPARPMACRAATGSVATRAFEAQLALAQGPCTQAMADRRWVHAEAGGFDLWPHYAPVAHELELRAQSAEPLVAGGKAVGVFTLYATRDRVIGERTRRVHRALAGAATVLVERLVTAENLELALESRTVISEAVGVLRERYGLGSEQAWAYLKRTASTREVKLRVVAESVIEDAVSQRPVAVRA